MSGPEYLNQLVNTAELHAVILVAHMRLAIHHELVRLTFQAFSPMTDVS